MYQYKVHINDDGYLCVSREDAIGAVIDALDYYGEEEIKVRIEKL